MLMNSLGERLVALQRAIRLIQRTLPIPWLEKVLKELRVKDMREGLGVPVPWLDLWMLFA